MLLENASEPFIERIEEDEIFYFSDSEGFSTKVKKFLLSQKKVKLFIFCGDILSFLSVDNDFFKVYKNYWGVFKTFYNYYKISKRKNVPEIAKSSVGDKVSKIIEKENKDDLKNFFEFAKECKKKKIKIIYFSGNHDSALSYDFLMPNYSYIPLLSKIYHLDSLYFPRDLELIKINQELFMIGIHTKSDTSECRNFPELNYYINTLESIEKPEQIIFISHIPGISKFSKLGSKDISNFKRKFKFKYHYHGHCKDYYGEYLEENVKTKSVHYKD
jgi:Icc-related predicted phosphoesterase